MLALVLQVDLDVFEQLELSIRIHAHRRARTGSRRGQQMLIRVRAEIVPTHPGGLLTQPGVVVGIHTPQEAMIALSHAHMAARYGRLFRFRCNAA